MLICSDINQILSRTIKYQTSLSGRSNRRKFLSWDLSTNSSRSYVVVVLVSNYLIRYSVVTSSACLRNVSAIVRTIKAILQLATSSLAYDSSKRLVITTESQTHVTCNSSRSNSSINLVNGQRWSFNQEVSSVVSGLTILLIQSNIVNTGIGSTHCIGGRNCYIQQISKNCSFVVSTFTTNKASCCVQSSEVDIVSVPILSQILGSNSQRLLSDSNSTHYCLINTLKVLITRYWIWNSVSTCIKSLYVILGNHIITKIVNQRTVSSTSVSSQQRLLWTIKGPVRNQSRSNGSGLTITYSYRNKSILIIIGSRTQVVVIVLIIC